MIQQNQSTTQNPTITFALDGEAIPLKNIKVNPSVQFQDKDQSGQTSSTAVAEQGIKPKELRVTGVINFTDAKILTRLFALAEAKDGGKLKRYRVANHTAKAINFRIGTFTGNIDASEIDGKMAWQITFTLREHLSVSEKKDARAAGQAQAKKQTGNPKAPTGAAKEEKDELTWFESTVLKPIDDFGNK
ncbi:baseplate complex protein [Providencia hangzhouensis]